MSESPMEGLRTLNGLADAVAGAPRVSLEVYWLGDEPEADPARELVQDSGPAFSTAASRTSSRRLRPSAVNPKKGRGRPAAPGSRGWRLSGNHASRASIREIVPASRKVSRECLQVMKRWMASLAWSWKDGLARSGKMSAWSTRGPVTVLAALA
jgi:hypothetical protein